VATATDPESYTLTTEYDGLDRVTKVTYPDTTFDQTTYNRLDVATRVDRQGRITRYYYDPARRLTATRDPLGQIIRQDWCACGSLDALADANGNRTQWNRDVQGRVTSEVRADGTTTTAYTYENTTSRLKTVTDPKGQVTTYTYALDDQVLQTVYTNAQIATPTVTYTYDPSYRRLATMVDEIGTTSYTYKLVGTLGAGQVATVDGPLTNDTITYTYDELGRVTNRDINGTGVTWAFDTLGRTTTEVNVLGTFSYTYDGTTNRLATVTYPNNQTSTYSYFGNTQDHRLQTIHHKYPNLATLSKFDYTYDTVGNILTWRQQADSMAVLWKYSYDGVDQLLTAVKESTATPPAVLQRFAYTYDPAGNRTSEQIDDAIVQANHDNLNRLVTQSAGGPLRFVGSTNEPATVTIQGQPSIVDSINVFRGTAATTSGANTVTIAATDPSGNQRVQQYQVSQSGPSKSFTYDANGNVTSDGTRTFEWNAANQMVATTFGNHRTEFSFDAQGLRVRRTDRLNGFVTADRQHVWCELELCEERDATSGAVTKRAFTSGEQQGSTAIFLVRDHLLSVRALINSAASVVARFDHEPFGRRIVTQAGPTTIYAYASLVIHEESALLFGIQRTYSPESGRWLSEDPAPNAIFLPDGPNIYSYVANRPATAIDPLGLYLFPVTTPPGPSPYPAQPNPGCPPTVEACSGYPSDSLLRTICMGTPDGPWSNCVRECLKNAYAKCSRLGCVIIDHLRCWTGCPGGQVRAVTNA
jgi:RHS repeat-associated protein